MSKIEKYLLPELSLRTYRRALAGIRPFRKSGIRLEVEKFGEKSVVHNYGHGGAGISLSPATAIEATEAVRSLTAFHDTNERIAVLGCGIVGLLSALELSKTSRKVRIYADRIPQPQ